MKLILFYILFLLIRIKCKMCYLALFRENNHFSSSCKKYNLFICFNNIFLFYNFIKPTHIVEERKEITKAIAVLK